MSGLKLLTGAYSCLSDFLFRKLTESLPELNGFKALEGRLRGLALDSALFSTLIASTLLGLATARSAPSSLADERQSHLLPISY
jgi:hypothetical protein